MLQDLYELSVAYAVIVGSANNRGHFTGDDLTRLEDLADQIRQHVEEELRDRNKGSLRILKY